MNSPVVVLLGLSLRSEVAEALLDAGYTPLEREDMQRTMTTLRREQAAGVLVDVAKCELDVLELLLNISDVAAEMPVGLITGKEPLDESLPKVEGLSNIVLLSGPMTAREIAASFCERLDGKSQATKSSKGEE